MKADSDIKQDTRQIYEWILEPIYKIIKEINLFRDLNFTIFNFLNSLFLRGMLMREIDINNLDIVTGGYAGADAKCLFWSTVAAVSPLAGPFAVVTSFGAAYFACTGDGTEYGDGCDYS